MPPDHPYPWPVIDLAPIASRAGNCTDTFLHDVVEGLSQARKSLPSKYLYDAEGSRLFDLICETPEYYPTRTEIALLAEAAPVVAESAPWNSTLVEFGSGASVKTQLLLDAAPHITHYVPVDISASALGGAAERIAQSYPGLRVTPVVADFAREMPLPGKCRGEACIAFFPGATIGNFTPAAALSLLRQWRTKLCLGARLLIGVDLVKDVATLQAAYDDAAGITGAFNMNLLVRLNRELGATFDLDGFAHRATWNACESRMEMHLVSRRAQQIEIAGRGFGFAAGETIHTENSYKYTLGRVFELADAARWTCEHSWIAQGPHDFAVLALKAR